MATCPKCGSDRIKFKRENQGEVRGKKSKQVVRQTVGMCENCGFTWVSGDDETRPVKKRKTWLWVLGWLCIFPVPLTILMLRKKEIKPTLKYGIIAAAWVVYLLIGLAGGSSGDSNEDIPTRSASSLEAVTTIPPEALESPDEKGWRLSDEAAAEDAREQAKLKLEEDLGGASVLYSDSVRNDTTKRWRLARISSLTPIQDCAVDYYRAYFDSDDELHFVVNFALNTTSVIGKYDDYLDVTVHEYVDGEEHDAKELGSGEVIGQYWVDIATGEKTDILSAIEEENRQEIQAQTTSAEAPAEPQPVQEVAPAEPKPVAPVERSIPIAAESPIEGPAPEPESPKEPARVSAAVHGTDRTISLDSGSLVWLPATGEKFHSINNCGNMNPEKARQFTIDYAVDRHFDACEKCW